MKEQLTKWRKKKHSGRMFFLIEVVKITTIQSRVPVESAGFSIYLYYQYH